jgi:hypothetical protein
MAELPAACRAVLTAPDAPPRARIGKPAGAAQRGN